jgi:Uma2 family endonuclease
MSGSQATIAGRQPARKTGLGERPKNTIAELLHRLGGVPPHRVLLRPTPGTATEADVLRLLEHNHRLCELIDGVLVEKPMGHRESRLAAWLIVALGSYLKEHKIGRLAGSDAPHRLPLGIVRMPDVAFISFERVPQNQSDDGAIVSWIPDLAVEVLSDSNTRREMSRKRREYFKAGVRLVWIADPRKRTVSVYRSAQDVRELGEDDELDGEDVLPGFRYSIREWMDSP